jgi:hypothetical protein
MTHKFTKRELAVLNFLKTHSENMERDYVEASDRKAASVEWYLGHAAEATIIYAHVLSILKGEDR